MIKRYFNWRSLLLIVALGIISGTVLYSRYLAKKIEREERQRIQEWVQAAKLVANTSIDQTDAITLSSLIITNNEDIPLIMTTDTDTILETRNLDSAKIKADKGYITDQLAEFKKLHDPVLLQISQQPIINYRVYYGNSDLLDEVQYYPIVQLIVVALFIIISLLLIVTQNKSTQNQVWAGMAKETAHQMGTPLTSLQGWVEILKDMPGNEVVVSEMEKDVDRLKLVSDRFGKIGSSPQLVETNLTNEINQMQEYMRRRASGRVEIIFNKPEEDVTALISPPLFDWVMENLMKNALDAMEGKGRLTITLSEAADTSIIDVSDTGKGIPSANIKKVFKPGFTTKKRGWGLGLTLCKRIIEQYHKGELFVKNSEIGKGTTFRIVINK
jgi:signal transduction histidine kinase